MSERIENKIKIKSWGVLENNLKRKALEAGTCAFCWID
jgi:hypothetical protein